MEHLNPIIIAAIVIQAFISGISRLAGAIAGYLITTGIFIWGLTVYNAGDVITLFGIPLTQQVFIFACIFWYGLDTYELSKNFRKESENIADEKSLENELSENI